LKSSKDKSKKVSQLNLKKKKMGNSLEKYEEKTFTQGKVDTFYDLVLPIDSITKLIESGVQFKVNETINSWNGNIVGVMGFSDEGKSFVLSNICSKPLPSGYHVNTNGLSISFMDSPQFRHIVLDSAGTQTPVIMTTDLPKIEKSDESETNPFEERKRTEDFLNSLILQLSDYILVVVDNLSWQKQKFIYEIIKDRYDKSNNSFTEIFIIHNLKHIKTMSTLMDQWKKIKKVYKGEEKEDPDTNVHYYYSNSQNSRHIILGNHESADIKAHNEKVFELLRKWINSIVVKENKEQKLEPLVDACKKIIPDFADNVTDVKFDEPTLTLTVIGESKKIKFASTMGKSIENFLPKRSVEIRNKHYVITLEIPGCNENSIQTKKCDSELAGHWGIIITGAKKEDFLDKANVKQNNRQFGQWEMSFDIPLTYKIQPPKIEFNNGIVTLTFEAPLDGG